MEKTHVFISHITEEAQTALCLKEYLRETLGWGIKVFVSSDLESIDGGAIWYKTIVDAIKDSLVEIVFPGCIGPNCPCTELRDAASKRIVAIDKTAHQKYERARLRFSGKALDKRYRPSLSLAVGRREC